MCDKQGQEVADAFCYDVCPHGYTGYGATCLKNCPKGFQDNGQTCEAPSILRKPIKSYISPCAPNQIDQNGNCYEPFQYSWYNKVTGCGCIRTYLKDRIHCPNGYVVYNSACVEACPPGTTEIRDSEGNLTSLFCYGQCPLKTNSKSERWTSLSGQCVKEYIPRLIQQTKGVSTAAQGIQYPVLGKPLTFLSYVSKRPYGSNQADRNRKGFTVPQSVASNPSDAAVGQALSDANTWLGLLSDPLSLLLVIGGIVFLVFAGPYLFPALGQGLGLIFKGLGFATEGAGKLVESGLEVGAATLNVASGAINVAASAEKSLASSIQSPIAPPSVAPPNIPTATSNQ